MNSIDERVATMLNDAASRVEVPMNLDAIIDGAQVHVKTAAHVPERRFPMVLSIATLGLLLIIDRSGSMTGEKIEMAKDAAKAAVELLSPRDYAGVVAFDEEAFWVAEMTSASDKGNFLQRIASIQPGGGTNIAAGLELGFSQISASPAISPAARCSITASHAASSCRAGAAERRPATR